jgi:hopanoid biosynthesis associated protein HpnK
LIVNADDFGLTSGVNRAILRAHNSGIVTSTTLMANGQGFEQAVELARAAPQLGVGCHVVLVDGTPVLQASRVGSLVDERGRFPAPISEFAWRCLRGRIAEDEVEAEVTAQIRKLKTAGIKVTHVDAHKHTHMFPPVLRPMLRAAKACGVQAVRNPVESIRLGHALRSGLWRRWGQLQVLRRIAGNFRKTVAEAGMITTDGTLGIVATGSLRAPMFRMILNHIPEGTWELVCHPGYNDAELDRIDTRLRESREQELELLTEPGLRQKLGERGIALISYSDLN